MANLAWTVQWLTSENAGSKLFSLLPANLPISLLMLIKRTQENTAKTLLQVLCPLKVLLKGIVILFITLSFPNPSRLSFPVANWTANW
jgi:hypothetical protein